MLHATWSKVNSPEELMMGRVLEGCLWVQVGAGRMLPAPVAQSPLENKSEAGSSDWFCTVVYQTSRKDLCGIVCCSIWLSLGASLSAAVSSVL